MSSEMNYQIHAEKWGVCYGIHLDRVLLAHKIAMKALMNSAKDSPEARM